MELETLMINNDVNVQPGWIFCRRYRHFYPPKKELQLNIEVRTGPVVFQVHDVTSKVMNSSKPELKYVKSDLKLLHSGQDFKFLFCSVSKERKLIQDMNKVDFEYASSVTYTFGLRLLIAFKENSLSFEDIEKLLISMWNNWEDVKSMNWVCSKIYFVKIYYENQLCENDPFIIIAKKAFVEMKDMLNMTCKDDSLISILATVKRLHCTILNRSEKMCNATQTTSKSNKFLSLLRNLLPLRELISPIGNNPRQHKDKRNLQIVIQELSVITNETGCAISTYRNDYKNPQLVVQSHIIRPTLPQSNDVTNAGADHSVPQTKVKGHCNLLYAPSGITEVSSVEPKTLTKSTNVNLTNLTNVSETPDIVQKCQVPELSAKTNSSESSKIYSVKDAAGLKKDTVHESEAVKGSPPLQTMNASKKLKYEPESILQQPSDVRENGGYQHKFYNCEEFGESRRTILLFGSNDRGQLSLLNLIWKLCCKNEDIQNCFPIVSTSGKMSEVTFYHFKYTSAAFQRLTVINTPELTSATIITLKELIKAGVVIIHSLAFVVQSRVSYLTAEEMELFNFIKSSFGEVSKHHIATILTFCDVSKNFPVLDEMRNIGIKGKITLELKNVDLDCVEKLDALGEALLNYDLKQIKRLLKTVNGMTPLSVKAIKMVQEEAFAKSHLEVTLNDLKREIEQFSSNLRILEGRELSIKNIWKLLNLVYAMQESEGSEASLLMFLATLLSNNASIDRKCHSEAFLILILSNEAMNFTSSVLACVSWNYELFSQICLEADEDNIDPSGTPLNENEATLFCRTCGDVHRCRRHSSSDTNFIALRCQDCDCNAKSHVLWTLQDMKDFLQCFCKSAYDALDEFLPELPKLPFAVDMQLLLRILSDILPEYKAFLNDVEAAGEKTKAHNSMK